MANPGATKAATTRRIRRRAAQWRVKYRYTPEQLADIRDMYRRRVVDVDGAKPGSVAEDWILHGKDSFWRCVAEARRETALLPHMRNYWRDQIMGHVRILRSAPVLREVAAAMEALSDG